MKHGKRRRRWGVRAAAQNAPVLLGEGQSEEEGSAENGHPGHGPAPPDLHPDLSGHGGADTRTRKDARARSASAQGRSGARSTGRFAAAPQRLRCGGWLWRGAGCDCAGGAGRAGGDLAAARLWPEVDGERRRPRRHRRPEEPPGGRERLLLHPVSGHDGLRGLRGVRAGGGGWVVSVAGLSGRRGVGSGMHGGQAADARTSLAQSGTRRRRSIGLAAVTVTAAVSAKGYSVSTDTRAPPPTCVGAGDGWWEGQR